MEVYSGLMKKAQAHELILGGLLIVYSAFDIRAPDAVNRFVSTTLGSILVILLAISLFLSVNPLIGIIGLIAAYELIRRSRNNYLSSDKALINYLPQTDSNCRDLNAYNQFGPTLEEEMVAKMAPLVGPSVGSVTYKPLMDDDHDATPLN